MGVQTLPTRASASGSPSHYADGPPLLLGEHLVQMGLITESQVQQAMDVRLRGNSFIGQILVDMGFIGANTLGPIIAARLGVRYIDLMAFEPDLKVFEQVGRELDREQILRSTKAFPLRASADSIEFAMVDPLDVGAIDRLGVVTGRRIVPSLTMEGELQTALNEVFDAKGRTNRVLKEMDDDEKDQPESATQAVLAAAAEAPIVRLVDSIIETAMTQRCSDIHFEPQEGGLRVRYRIDGMLLQHVMIPPTQMTAVVARLKVICGMDVTESRRPQDGRMRHTTAEGVYDIRASCIKTVFGEKMVLRILDKSSVLVPLSRLGFLPDQQKRFDALILQPHGMVLVVGPTGSGKSATLYSSLNLLNDAKRNIMTLEDPVEYNVPGLNQVQVNTRIGLNFASGLRTFVRQDPDVILVGEIRDHETAEMAVQASLTGHLLLSTLHANSAVGCITRLSNLGVDPFLIAQALSGVVSQRLCAKVCTLCSEQYEPTREVLEAVGITPEEAVGMKFRRGRGCKPCHGRGYSGRLGVFEVLYADEDIRQMIMRATSEDDMQALAEKRGMRSLRDAALEMVRQGVTTPEEMGRVVLTKA